MQKVTESTLNYNKNELIIERFQFRMTTRDEQQQTFRCVQLRFCHEIYICTSLPWPLHKF